MHKVLMVIRREYLDRVRKKSFWIGTLVFPLIMVLFILGPMALTMLSSGAPKKIAVVDATGRLFEPMQTELQTRRQAETAADKGKKEAKKETKDGLVLESVPLQGTVEATYAALKPRLNKDDLFAVVTIGNELDAKTNFHFYGRNVGDPRTQQRLESALERAVTLLRLERADLKADPATLRKAMASILEALSPMRMLWFLVFFVLGYFMYTALFAAVGAVCNSEQEAQNLQSPVIMCLVIPMVATFFFVSQPDSTVARVVSLIPLFTPMVMVMRINTLAPPLWEILLSIVLTLGFTWLLFRGVAKIFRIGILMYGKRPTVPEILRWARS
jgi:ABC-type Na+ efflux pump permease subunit